MHGTFKSETTLKATPAKPDTARIAAAKARADQKARDQAFQREFALAKTKPVRSSSPRSKTLFC